MSRNAGKLAAAVKVLLTLEELDPDTGLQVAWDLIENEVSRSELRAAVAAIDELVPPADAELDGQRMEELAGRLATVWPFLPLLMETVEFGATGDGAPVLAAMKMLATLLTMKSKVPVTYLNARQVDHDLITGGWQRLVYAPGRPEGTVDRAAYVFCLLEQFHWHIKHRNIFATASSRWRDPRAHLLSGSAWDTARGPGMNALGLPDQPDAMLAGTRPPWTPRTGGHVPAGRGHPGHRGRRGPAARRRAVGGSGSAVAGGPALDPLGQPLRCSTARVRVAQPAHQRTYLTRRLIAIPSRSRAPQQVQLQSALA